MKLYVAIILLGLLVCPGNGFSFELFKNCLKMDKTFSHHIVDTDILRLENSEFYSAALVQCVNKKSRHAFSFFEGGQPLHPDSAVRLVADENGDVCEGDTIFVYDEECVILSLNKAKMAVNPNVEANKGEEGKEGFILWRKEKEREKTMEELKNK